MRISYNKLWKMLIDKEMDKQDLKEKSGVISLDAEIVRNDGSFEKFVYLFETCFKNGGVHFQLTYVSKKDLLNAKKTPENHGNLRVRVTGFSDYFVRLSGGMQNDIIKRTEQR